MIPVPKERALTSYGARNRRGYGPAKPGLGDVDFAASYWGGTYGRYLGGGGGRKGREGSDGTAGGYLGPYSNKYSYRDPSTYPGYVYSYSSGLDPMYGSMGPYTNSIDERSMTLINYSVESYGAYHSSEAINNMSSKVGYTIDIPPYAGKCGKR